MDDLITEQSDNRCWLLLGGAGFIGSHVARAMSEAGIRVVILDNLSTGLESRVENCADLIIGDASDKERIVDICLKYNVQGVINLAAYMQARESVRDPIKYWKNNIGVSIALAEAIKLLSLSRVILSSSCSVYGNVSNATDNTSLNPLSPYAYSKVASEQIISQACNENDVDFVSLRYFNVIGGGDFPNSIDVKEETLVPSVCRKIASGESPVIFGGSLPTRDGTCERDYVDVRDVAHAHLLVSEHNEKFDNEYLNISTGNSVTVLEIVREILTISEAKTEITFENAKMGDPVSVSALPSMKLLKLGWVPRYNLRNSIESHWKAFVTNQ